MNHRLNNTEPAEDYPSSGIQFLLLLSWVISFVLAAQLFVRSEALLWPIIAAIICAVCLAAWLWRMRRAGRASGNATERAFGRFTLFHTLLILAYALGLVLAMSWLDGATQPVVRIGLIALPSLALAGWAWVFGAMIYSSDEMMRELRTRAVALSAGAVLVLATLWGLFASLTSLPAFPGFLLMPGFALVYVVALQILGGDDA